MSRKLLAGTYRVLCAQIGVRMLPRNADEGGLLLGGIGFHATSHFFQIQFHVFAASSERVRREDRSSGALCPDPFRYRNPMGPHAAHPMCARVQACVHFPEGVVMIDEQQPEGSELTSRARADRIEALHRAASAAQARHDMDLDARMHDNGCFTGCICFRPASPTADGHRW